MVPTKLIFTVPLRDAIARIPRHSQVAPAFLKPNSNLRRALETACGQLSLADIPPEGLVFTSHNVIVVPVLPDIVSNNGRTPMWGISTNHKAKAPGLSPMFLQNDQYAEKTQTLTISFTLSKKGSDMPIPDIRSVKVGNERPPLPWQLSAKKWDGFTADDPYMGIEGCKRFWREHSMLVMNERQIRPGTWTDKAPKWFDER